MLRDGGWKVIRPFLSDRFRLLPSARRYLARACSRITRAGLDPWSGRNFRHLIFHPSSVRVRFHRLYRVRFVPIDNLWHLIESFFQG